MHDEGDMPDIGGSTGPDSLVHATQGSIENENSHMDRMCTCTRCGSACTVVPTTEVYYGTQLLLVFWVCESIRIKANQERNWNDAKDVELTSVPNRKEGQSKYMQHWLQHRRLQKREATIHWLQTFFLLEMNVTTLQSHLMHQIGVKRTWIKEKQGKQECGK